MTEIIDLLKKYTDGKQNTEKVEISVLQLNRVIKALEQEPKWIPVSERLPEDDELYLVYTEEQPFVCPFKDGEFFIDEVIAWMPLPPSYQGE